MPDYRQIAAVRKHAASFAQSARKLGVDLEKPELHRLTWADLNALESDARHTSKDLPAQISDGISEERAAELERAFDALTDFVARCSAEKDGRTARNNKGPHAGVDLSKRPHFEPRSAPAVDGGCEETDAFALAPEQRFRTYAEARGADAPDIGIGRFLRALTTGARSDAEQRALAGGTDAAGGFTVPTVLSGELIDLARAEMVLTQAGARTIPLDSDQNVIARLASDPVPAWRVENAAITESDPTFAGVTLAPKSVAVLVKASVELMQDSLNLEAELPRVLARALAQEIDRAGLIGSGSGAVPRGIVNYTGLTANTFAGGAIGYAALLNARGALHGANENLGAIVMASRDENALAGLVASDGQPLQMPRALEGVKILHTTVLPIDGGAGSNESQVIAGDFAQLLIGVRSTIRVEILRERFMDNLQFGLIAHARIDFAAARQSAFTVLDAVTPA